MHEIKLGFSISLLALVVHTFKKISLVTFVICLIFRNNNKKEPLHPSINGPTTSTTGNQKKYYESGDIIKEPTMMSNTKDELTREFVRLTLDSDCESLGKFSELSVNDCGKSPLAGRVTAVAKVLGFIIVKPAMPHEFLLNLGSPVFLAKSSRTYVTHEEKVGNVIDVFGPTYEPYYCVRPVKNGIDLVHEGTRLLYKPNHPSTTFVRIKRTRDNQYTVLYSQEWPSNINQRKSTYKIIANGGRGRGIIQGV